MVFYFFFSSRRRHTRFDCDWSSDVCSSDLIEELRQMGNEVLHGWARRQQEKKEQEYNAKPGVNRKEKKNLYWHTRLGKIEIAEEVFTQGRGGPETRPFCASAEVQGRGDSEGLQRAMTDFGAENAFARAAARSEERRVGEECRSRWSPYD